MHAALSSNEGRRSAIGGADHDDGNIENFTPTQAKQVHFYGQSQSTS